MNYIILINLLLLYFFFLNLTLKREGEETWIVVPLTDALPGGFRLCPHRVSLPGLLEHIRLERGQSYRSSHSGDGRVFNRPPLFCLGDLGPCRGRKLFLFFFFFFSFGICLEVEYPVSSGDGLGPTSAWSMRNRSGVEKSSQF